MSYYPGPIGPRLGNWWFKSYKGRRHPGNHAMVKVYRNLTAKHPQGLPVYSIQDARTGLVLGHTTCALISKARFEVSAAGRDRVRATGRKVVHAYVVGYLSGTSWDINMYEKFNGSLKSNCNCSGCKPIVKGTYNPYKNDEFVYKTGEKAGKPLAPCGLALLDSTGLTVTC